MPNQPAPEIELLRAAYAAFNARDIDAALALMTPDVEWPRAFKGGFVHGPEEGLPLSRRRIVLRR